MKDGTVSILEGSTFVVSDSNGDIEASPTTPNGLFLGDMRLLSRWKLTVNGNKPTPLSTDDLQYNSAQFFLVVPTGSMYEDAKISLVRRRAVGQGFHEDLAIRNHGADAVDLDLRIEAAADFADLFEVKDHQAKKGRLYQHTEDGQLTLGYQREKFVRETVITSSAPATFDEAGLSFKVHLEPKAEWSTNLDVIAAKAGPQTGHAETKYRDSEEKPRPNVGMSLEDWLAKSPVVASSRESIVRTYKRSMLDLAALRFYPAIAPGESIPAAGLPWFMALFGRDSIITSLQALPFSPELASTTLRVLAARQGTRIDDFRDEEPGKILHESRMGELTAFEERPHSPYYGSSDTTPLWLVLLDEYERWSGDKALVHELKPNALAALRWIDEFGDRDGDGYIEYSRRMESGLDNQCWKDSWDSIAFHDGTIAPLPRATCEIQGYAYDAKRRGARLAREVWGDRALADHLDAQAADLKRRFNQDFWIDDRQFFALALDGEKRKVDSLSSNLGHLLWSGIVEDDKAAAIAGHLMSSALFSGWGTRTMAEGEGSYNPIGYHVGTVWPHDTAFVALGLARYGYREAASRLALAIFDAASYFDYRLPETFAGYSRTETSYPVEFPTACSPQAWATGAPLLLLRVLLGLEPVGNDLLVSPAIPTEIERLEVLGIPGRWGRADAFGRGLLEACADGAGSRTHGMPV